MTLLIASVFQTAFCSAGDGDLKSCLFPDVYDLYFSFLFKFCLAGKCLPV